GGTGAACGGCVGGLALRTGIPAQGMAREEPPFPGLCPAAVPLDGRARSHPPHRYATAGSSIRNHTARPQAEHRTDDAAHALTAPLQSPVFPLSRQCHAPFAIPPL